MNNAESVRQFQPRVALWQPWENLFLEGATLKELRRRSLTATLRNPFRVANNLIGHFWTQGFKANPGLTLANAFSVTRFLPGNEYQA